MDSRPRPDRTPDRRARAGTSGGLGRRPMGKARLLASLLVTSILMSSPALIPARAAATGPLVSTVASTVPANGDVNPYGVAVVPRSMGRLVQGAVLVSNFNDKKNQAGTGTTIVQILPSGAPRLFAQIDPAHLPGPCPGGIGLTTALTVLRRGYVIVGSLPTADGRPATMRAGCLLVLDNAGRVASDTRTITYPGNCYLSGEFHFDFVRAN